MGLRIVAALSGQLASLGSVCPAPMGTRRLDRGYCSMIPPHLHFHCCCAARSQVARESPGRADAIWFWAVPAHAFCGVMHWLVQGLAMPALSLPLTSRQ